MLEVRCILSVVMARGTPRDRAGSSPKMRGALEMPVSVCQLSNCIVLHSPYFTPILIAIPGDRTPNLTMITITTNHYTPYPMQRPWPLLILCNAPGHSLSYATPLATPYPMQRPWPRLSHSLMAVCLMFTLYQILQHAYHTASHLGASCISSPLYDPYLASCSSHVLLMTRTRPIGYDPLI